MYSRNNVSSRVSTLPTLLAALLSLAVAPAARAAEELADLPPLSADADALLAASAGEAPVEADVEVVLLSARYTVEPDGRATFRQHQIYRVLTAAGADGWNEVSRTYAPWHQERPVVRARVVLPSGQVHSLDPDTLTDQPVASHLPDTYQDLRRLAAPLPAVAPGVVVEELVEVVDRAPFFAPGVVRRQPLLQNAPVRLARVVVDVPEGMEVRFAARPAELAEPRIERAEGRVRRVFELRDLEPAGVWQPGLPPEEIPYPFVAFATGADWSSLARAYSEVVDRQIEAAGGSALERLGAPVGGGDSQWGQIAEILGRVHATVRYTGVQLGEAAIVPRPPSETLSRRYGDCKDKATLMVALLREIGVPAYVALLRAGSTDDVLPELPGLGAGGFDHAIVYVPGNPALWIDATDPHAPLGELPTAAQGRLALVASPTTRGLVQTPVASADENRIGEEREVFLAEFGPARVVERSVQRGAAARSLRSLWDGLTDEEILEELATYAEATYGTAEISGLEHSGFDAPGPLEIRFEVPEAGWAVTDLAQGVVVVPTGALLQRLPYLGEADEEDERTSDFLVDEPHEVEWLYRIHVPDGFAPRELPEDRVRILGPATLTTAIEETAGEVRARFTFRLAERRFGADQLDALREAVEELQEEGNLLLWFDNVGWSHLAAGRIDEAVAEYRRLEAAHPTEALHKLQLAKAVTEVGLHEEARRLAERAVELEPENGIAHALLGEILLRGPLSRGLQHGFDREAAIAALRRARELEPDNLEATVNLAVALEHDSTGRRYADPEGLREAIEIYRGIQDELAGTDHRNNLAIALIRAERPKEALEAMDAAPEGLPEYALGVAAEAMANGSDAAIRRAERRVSGGRAERAAILALASQTLMSVRRYPEAAELMRTAAHASPDSAGMSATVDMLSKIRRHEEMGARLAGPLAAGFDFLKAVLSPVFDTEEVRRYLAVRWFEGLDDEALHATIFEDVDFDLTAPAQAGLPEEAALDILASLPTWTVEEAPPLGFLVHLEMKGAAREEETTMVAVRDGDSYRFAGSDDEPEMYGRYAFELARAGEVERARAFLDRALEVTEPPEEDVTVQSPGEALHAVWPADDPNDPAAVTFAAAVLAAADFPDQELVEVLRDAELPPAKRLARDQALAQALLELGRAGEALDPARRVEEANGVELYVEMALGALGRFDELAARMEDAGSEDRDEDEDRLRRTKRAFFLMEAGHHEEALAAFAALLEEKDHAARTYNQAAWLALTLGDLSERTLEWARLAAERSQFSEHAPLHTLATVQAEMGRTVDAYETLVKAVDSLPDRRPSEHDWYVLGRIAEHLGFPAAAREYYERLAAPAADEDATSTRVMAQSRLRALSGP